MNILYIAHNFPSETNPTFGVFAARQAKEMQRQGHNVTVLTPVVWCPSFLKRFKRWRDYDHNCKHSFQGLDAITASYLRLPTRWYRTIEARVINWTIREKVKQLHALENFDIVYSRFLHPEGYAAVALGKYLDLPTVGVGAGSDVNVFPNGDIFYRRHIKRLLIKFDALLASGKGVADNIKKMVGLEPEIVYGVVDLDKFSPLADKTALRQKLNISQSRVTVLFLGGYKITKGVYELIDAFEKIVKVDNNIELKFCGYGREEDGMRIIVKQKGLEGNVEILGRVDGDEVHRWMQACDLFILPSYAEGMPNAVMEAMACGLPVIATAVGGLPDAIGDCKGAILVPPKNIGAIVKAVLEIAQDANLRKKMAEAARLKSEESFGVSQNVAKVIKCFEKVIQKRNKG